MRSAKKAGRLAPVGLCLLVGACCTVGGGGGATLNDWPGEAPALGGTWQAIDDGSVVLSVSIDASGDPRQVTISSSLLGNDLPLDVPNPVLLDGLSHPLNVPDLPITASYVARARATKTNPSGPIAVGEAVNITIELELYASIPLSGTLKVGTGLITYAGTFDTTSQATGNVRAIVTLSSEARSILQAFTSDVPGNIDESLTGVILRRI